MPSARKHTVASSGGDIHSDPLYFLLPQFTPPLSSLRPRVARKHTGASAVGDVHSDVLYLLLTQLTPLFSLSIPRAHLPTPPDWSPIPKARHRDAAATVVIPKYLIPRTHCLFLFLSQHFRCRRQSCGPGSERLLTFGLLTLYLFLWQFAAVTVGRGCLPNLVGDGTVENS